MSETAQPVVFVAGSTGYVGQAVVAELRARDIVTIAHIRPGSPRLAGMRPTFENLGATVDAAPWELEALTEVLREHRVSHIFCLIGTTRKQAGAEGLKGNIYEQIDLGLTALLVDASVASGLFPRLVYLSSIGASPGAGSSYLKARGQAEAKVRETGLSHFIARPSFITGADRDESRPAERIGAAVADGALSVVSLFGGKKLKARYESTTARALASRLVDAALGVETGIHEGAGLRRLSE